MMLGLGILRWNPKAFWRATPRELLAAWEGLTGERTLEPAVSRDLNRLMEAFPDEASVQEANAFTTGALEAR